MPMSYVYPPYTVRSRTLSLAANADQFLRPDERRNACREPATEPVDGGRIAAAGRDFIAEIDHSPLNRFSYVQHGPARIRCQPPGQMQDRSCAVLRRQNAVVEPAHQAAARSRRNGLNDGQPIRAQFDQLIRREELTPPRDGGNAPRQTEIEAPTPCRVAQRGSIPDDGVLRRAGREMQRLQP